MRPIVKGRVCDARSLGKETNLDLGRETFFETPPLIRGMRGPFPSVPSACEFGFPFEMPAAAGAKLTRTVLEWRAAVLPAKIRRRGAGLPFLYAPLLRTPASPIDCIAGVSLGREFPHPPNAAPAMG